MGACIRKGKVQQNMQEYICSALMIAIETGRLEDIKQLHAKYMRKDGQSPVFDVDEKIVTLQEVPLNALAYAFRAGQSEIARFLLEEAHSSLRKLYETYQQINRTPFDIACEYGSLSLAQYFLPVHLAEGSKLFQLTSPPNESQEELSIFAENRTKSSMKPAGLYQPAIHRACERGHIEVVRYLYRTFQGKTPPADCDIEATDERAGENCALVSVRSGDLTMIRFLHEECSADFMKLNRRRENALQVAVIGAKRKPGVNFVSVVKYLVETVGVDVTYQYEETLLICEDKSLVFYIENQLYLRGIYVSKTKIDQENSISNNRAARHMSDKSQEFDQKCRAVGAKFELKELFGELPPKSEDISSIQPQSDHSGLLTPF